MLYIFFISNIDSFNVIYLKGIFHNSLLISFYVKQITCSTVANALIYSYSESFTGFSASLTQNERQKLKSKGKTLVSLRLYFHLIIYK